MRVQHTIEVEYDDGHRERQVCTNLELYEVGSRWADQIYGDTFTVVAHNPPERYVYRGRESLRQSRAMYWHVYQACKHNVRFTMLPNMSHCKVQA